MVFWRWASNRAKEFREEADPTLRGLFQGTERDLEHVKGMEKDLEILDSYLQISSSSSLALNSDKDKEYSSSYRNKEKDKNKEQEKSEKKNMVSV